MQNILLLFLKLLLSAAGLYLTYALIAALLPYTLPKKTGKAYRDTHKARRFYGEGSVDRAALVETPSDAFVQRIQLIRAASETLDVVYHCVKSGRTTEYFFGELLRAAHRGVKIRLVLDGKVGGMVGPHAWIAYALAVHPNISYRIYNPVGILTPWKWNTLLHDKFMIADDRLLMLGGRNIGDAYFAPPGYTGRVTHDRDVILFNTAHGTDNRDSVLFQVQTYMEELWAHRDTKQTCCVMSAPKRAIGQMTASTLMENDIALEEDYPQVLEIVENYAAVTVPCASVQLLRNPLNASKKEPWVGYSLSQLAGDAQEEVLVQTPYCTGNRYILNALRTVGRNLPGKLTMLTNSPASSRNPVAFSNYMVSRGRILSTDTRILEYQSRDSIHGKSVLMDRRLSAVGSFNLDERSMYIDTETMLIIDSPAFYETLQGAIDTFTAQSLELETAGKYRQGDIPPRRLSPIKGALLWLTSIFSSLFRFLV